MNNMVTFRYEGDDAILRLNGMARASLYELLEMLDLDGFSIAPEDKEILEETKFQVMTAVGRAGS